MTRLACLRAAACAAALLVALVARPAAASDPVSVYVAASRVDTMPNDDAATSVVIHGAFLLLQADGSYLPPQCGAMYFQCPAGSETMCRLQWQDVRTIGTGATTCAGFGTLRVVSTATVRPEGAALASPDAWELGIGVATGVSVSGQCPPAKALKCPAPSGSGGASGMSGAGGATGSAGAGSGEAGSEGSGGASGAGGTTGSAGTSGAAGTTGAAGTGGGTTTGKGGGEVLPNRSGCALAPEPRWRAVAIPIVMLLAAAAWRRRRR